VGCLLESASGSTGKKFILDKEKTLKLDVETMVEYGVGEKKRL